MEVIGVGQPFGNQLYHQKLKNLPRKKKIMCWQLKKTRREEVYLCLDFAIYVDVSQRMWRMPCFVARMLTVYGRLCEHPGISHLIYMSRLIPIPGSKKF
jgi:hypothetical protein